VIVHVPAAAVVTVESATVHTDGVSELNSTGSPDDACADRETGVPTVTPGGCSNVIVCGNVLAATLTWEVSQAFWICADGLVSG
jgi:hypothetical protein